LINHRSYSLIGEITDHHLGRILRNLLEIHREALSKP
jgi:hypothetical protein